ncbi:hypothetical protein [Streptomyces collinus]|uniref:hypothetical protein n=1 Tax=Streptomyces collinus TaxID=42684 RepID=UPI0036C4DE04
MGTLPPDLFRSWVHSFEEDAGDVTVYRPAEYPFPPARGRGGMEFGPDGVFVNHPVGRGDAPEAVPCRWRLLAERRLAVRCPRSVGGDWERELEIVHCGDDVLRVRWTHPGQR